MLPRAFVLAIVLAALEPGVAAASAPVPIEVVLSTSLEVKLDMSYGREQAAVLRAAVADSLRQAIAREAPLGQALNGASIVVVVEDARPSHPTPRQLADDPSIDFTRSLALGGAELTGSVRSADGRMLATVSQRGWPASLDVASPAADPWADARVAINRFALKLATALKRAG
jgi:hypothetical protein